MDSAKVWHQIVNEQSIGIIECHNEAANELEETVHRSYGKFLENNLCFFSDENSKREARLSGLHIIAPASRRICWKI
jgi:hypothetical protein